MHWRLAHDDCTIFKKMFGAMHFISYINRSIATKVDSSYLGYNNCLTAHSTYVLWRAVGTKK